MDSRKRYKLTSQHNKEEKRWTLTKSFRWEVLRVVRMLTFPLEENEREREAPLESAGAREVEECKAPYMKRWAGDGPHMSQWLHG